jgi:hypothetical protein
MEKQEEKKVKYIPQEFKFWQFKLIQAFLILCGCDAGGRLIADGKWKKYSVQALAEYQDFFVEGVPTGELDEKTLLSFSGGTGLDLDKVPSLKELQAAMMLDIMCGEFWQEEKWWFGVGDEEEIDFDVVFKDFKANGKCDKETRKWILTYMKVRRTVNEYFSLDSLLPDPDHLGIELEDGDYW